MKMPNLAELLLFTIVFALVICGGAAWSGNVANGGNKGDEVTDEGKIVVQIFDNAIQKFVTAFAQKDPGINGDHDGNQLNLSYATAAVIIKEIQERMIINFKLTNLRHIPILYMNFHKTLNAIHQQVQTKLAKSKGKVVDKLEHSSNLWRAEEKQEHHEQSGQLFRLLLAFALRLGFHIGHTALNEGRQRWDEQIRLHLFVDALEKSLGKSFEQSANFLYHPVLFQNEPADKLVKVRFDPGKEWNEWQIQYNLGTLRWLLNDSKCMGLGSENWLHFVQQIAQLPSVGKSYRVEDPRRPTDAALERLMVGWTKCSKYIVDVVTFCGHKTFGKNVLKRLLSFKKVNTYIDENGKRKEINATLGSLKADLDMHCNGDKLKQKMEENGIKPDALARRESFMHYEDIIVYNGSRRSDYLRYLTNHIIPELRKWQGELAKCKITRRGLLRRMITDEFILSISNCDLKYILHNIGFFKRGELTNGMSFYRFFAAIEFDLDVEWKLFLKICELFDTLTSDMRKTNESIGLGKSLHSLVNKEKRKAINAEVVEMEGKLAKTQTVKFKTK